MLHDPKFWLAIAFVTFIALIVKFAKTFILKSLEAKSKAIAEEILSAKEMKDRAAALLKKAEKYAKDSENFATKLLKDAEDEAKKFAADAAKMMENEIAKKTAASIERIRMEEVIAIREIKSRIVNLAIADLSQNISKELNAESHDQLVTKALGDFEKVIH
jgi:F-type H+-transporting ATPase subunit b